MLKIDFKNRRLKSALTVVLILALIWPILSFVIVKVIFEVNFSRTEKPEYTRYLTFEDTKGKYKRKAVTFKSGKNTLKGYVYGEENKKGLIVMSHGLGMGAQTYLNISLYFVDRGWRVLAYDNTGTYESEGSGKNGMSQSLIDLEAALTFVESNKELGQMPRFLFGHSWGGYAVSTVSALGHKAKGIACVAAYNSPLDVMFEQALKYTGPLAYLLYPTCVYYQNMKFGKYADLKAVDAINSSGNTPIFIAHGIEDETISYFGASIVSKLSDIRNINAKYYISTEPYESHHGDIFLSVNAAIYVEEQEKKWKEIEKKYIFFVPEYEKSKYYAEMDKVLINEINMELINEINLFYEKNLK